jgi:membrane dipeptidase
MVNFSPDFISCVDVGDPSGLPKYIDANNTLAQVVRHITYIGDLIGYSHVGIGTDYDGIETTPRGLEDVSKFPALVEALLDAGVGKGDVAKVVGRNLLRVWHEVDRVAAELRERMGPVEEDLGFDWD